MRFDEVSIPEVYERESADFRFFLDWFADALAKVQYDTTNFFDLFDPLRCPENLLWMLADTMGFKRDDKLPTAFNRLVLLYFMSMIRNRGSKTGMTLAAEVNLAQFNILKYGEEKEILKNRLEDTSIPINAVYVSPNVELGYIELVYFSDKLPYDACIEYVRPLGMYLFPFAGVRFDARTKISIDARLTDLREWDRPGYPYGSMAAGPDLNTGYRRGGPTRVGRYHPEDYAMLQETDPETRWRWDKEYLDPVKYYEKVKEEREKLTNQSEWKNWTDEHLDGIDTSKMTKREKAWYRNSKGEIEGVSLDAGFRALESLQLTNNQHVVQSLIEPIFSIGYGMGDPQTDGPNIYYPQSYVRPPYQDQPLYNLRYNRELEHSLREASLGIQRPQNDSSGSTLSSTYEYPEAHAPVLQPDIYTTEDTSTPIKPVPRVNPIMHRLGDAMNIDETLNTGKENETFTEVDINGKVWVVDKDGNRLPEFTQFNSELK